MRSTPRVVLDTNVVLSALLFRTGRLAPFRAAWQSRTLEPLVSTATAEELLRALSYPKFKLSADNRRELLADYLPYCTTIRILRALPDLPRCRDPFDVVFLQLAVVGKAGYLVTGDKDLLDLDGRIRCAIVTPQQLASVMERS